MSYGSPLLQFSEVVSTMDTARSWALAGAPDGSAVTAARQSGGRGRRGASWETSSVCDSLITTFIVRTELGLSEYWKISFAASLAVQQMALEAGVESARVKWPNDVVAGAGKFCGILVETVSMPKSDEQAALIGIGINVNQLGFSNSKAYRMPPTSLRMLGEGQKFEIGELFSMLCARLETHIREIETPAGWHAVAASWGAVMMRGVLQSGVDINEEKVQGTVRSLRLEDGAALVELSDGTISAMWPVI
jgi:BirA family biotin operon repressor/biotin-[acetyl-CoA-carboxylase] ligase